MLLIGGGSGGKIRDTSKIALNHIQIIFLRSKTSLTFFSLVEGAVGKSADMSESQQKGRKNNTFVKTYPDIFYVLKPPYLAFHWCIGRAGKIRDKSRYQAKKKGGKITHFSISLLVSASKDLMVIQS